MKGAREYAQLFETGQDGRFYIVSGKHARGLTFRIQILPEGKEAIPNGHGNLCINNDAVLVYGVISGQPGWTESYGWLYRGPWEKDFMKLVDKTKKDKLSSEDAISQKLKARNEQEKQRVKVLLDAY